MAESVTFAERRVSKKSKYFLGGCESCNKLYMNYCMK